MAIETTCRCGRRLRVADEHAGKKARCPECSVLYIVPIASGARSSTSSAGERTEDASNAPTANARGEAAPSNNAAPDRQSAHRESGHSESGRAGSAQSGQPGSATVDSQRDRQRHSPVGRPTTPSSGSGSSGSPFEPRPTSGSPTWMFRSENGHVYGPVDRPRLRQWAREGRVSDLCRLQLIGGDGRWEPIRTWFDPAELEHPATRAQEARRDVARYSEPMVIGDDTAPEEWLVSSAGQTRPHRGWLILCIVLLGVFFPVVAAGGWAMGQRDLALMDSGRMNEGGRTLTVFAITLAVCILGAQSVWIFALLG